MSESVPQDADDAGSESSFQVENSFRIDVGRIINTSARQVAAADLEGEVVRVIDPKQIDDAIAQSVDDALREHEAKLGHSVRREVGLEASRRFVDLMAEHQLALEERREAVRARRELERELSALREQLGVERKRLERDQRKDFTLSDEGLRDLEAHLRGVVGSFAKNQKRRARGGPQGAPLRELPELEQTLGRVIHRVIAKERLLSFRPMEEKELKEMEVLEQRIGELQQRLGQRESELAALRERPVGPRLGASPQPAPMMRAGPSRHSVLAVIFNENLKLREGRSAAR